MLYDESHPLGDDIGSIHTADLGKKPDMLIIMGTSLKVHGLKKLVKDFARTIHTNASPSASSSSKKPYKVIFVNKTAPGLEWADIIDYHISGETDAWTTKVIEDWKKMRPADWEIQQTLLAGVGETSMSVGMQTVKTQVSSTAKSKTQPSGRENIPPPTLGKSDPFLAEKPSVPLSPSKRRQKSSHYDDVHSSPSKRQSTYKGQHHVPEEERKMLFSNSTNLPSDTPSDMGDSSKMSITLADLSIREDSAMDISLLDISMKAEESIIVVKPRTQTRSTMATNTKPSAPSAPVIPKSQPSQRQVVAKKVVSEKKSSRKKQAAISVS